MYGKSKPYVRKVAAPLTAPEGASIDFDAGMLRINVSSATPATPVTSELPKVKLLNSIM